MESTSIWPSESSTSLLLRFCSARYSVSVHCPCNGKSSATGQDGLPGSEGGGWENVGEKAGVSIDHSCRGRLVRGPQQDVGVEKVTSHERFTRK